MSESRVSVEVDASKQEVLLQVEGAFDFNLHKSFSEGFRSAPYRRYVVDLVQTTYLDSSALGSLLQLKEFAESRGGSVEVVAAGGLVQDTLEMAHFDRILKVRLEAA